MDAVHLNRDLVPLAVHLDRESENAAITLGFGPKQHVQDCLSEVV